MKIILWFASSIVFLGLSCSPVLAQEAWNSRTPSEMMAFHETRMQDVLQRQFGQQQHPLPDINARIAHLMEIISRRWPTARFAVRPMMGYSPRGQSTYLMSGVDDGNPFIEFFIPAFMDRYQRLVSERALDVSAAFENAMIVGMAHELDHIALEALHGFPEHPSAEDMIQAEVHAWAETCEHTIRVFAEKGLLLDVSDRTVYEEWVKAGRSATSPQWVAMVRKAYTMHRD